MSQAYRGSQKMLLCVDDSPSILEYEKRLFERSGYTVMTAESPRRGLRLATLFTFDAVLVDYWMPEMSGHDFAYEIRRLRPETPIVMCSSSEIPEETRQLVDAFVSKNVAHRELLPTVTRICDRPMPQ
jgi:CheY-like chemotaxis protein